MSGWQAGVRKHRRGISSPGCAKTHVNTQPVSVSNPSASGRNKGKYGCGNKIFQEYIVQTRLFTSCEQRPQLIF